MSADVGVGDGDATCAVAAGDIEVDIMRSTPPRCQLHDLRRVPDRVLLRWSPVVAVGVVAAVAVVCVFVVQRP